LGALAHRDEANHVRQSRLHATQDCTGVQIKPTLTSTLTTLGTKASRLSAWKVIMGNLTKIAAQAAALFLLLILMSWLEAKSFLRSPEKVQHGTKQEAIETKTPPDTTEQMNPLSNNSSSKPYFVIYPGPHKTGTTSAQALLTRLSSEGVLEKDNYIYLGRFTAKEHWSPVLRSMISVRTASSTIIQPGCRLHNATQCWETVAVPAAEQLLAMDPLPNLLVYEEYVESAQLLDVEALRRTFSQYQFLVVVGYRRQWSYDVSYKNQRGKRLANDWPAPNTTLARPLPAVPFYTDKAKQTLSTTEERANLYSAFFGRENVRIFSMYYRTNLLEHFACDILPRARHLCQASKATSPVHSNPSTNLTLDYIAVELADRGWIDTEKYKDRQDAVQKLRDCAENLRLGSHDECLSPSIAELYLNHSLAMEQNIVDKFGDLSPWLHDLVTPKARQEHNTSFRSSFHEFCSPNISAVLQDEGWKECISSLD